METQPIYSTEQQPDEIRLYLADWKWTIKGKEYVSKDVITPRIAFNYDAMKKIAHVKKRAVKNLKISEATKAKMFAGGIPDPDEIRINELMYAGTSFQTIDQIMENQTIPPKKIMVESCPIWNEVICIESEKEYYKNLVKFLKEEKEKHILFPKPSETFNAFKLTSFNRTCVVIIGQDPYHTPGTAHGLAFSSIGLNTPPSLHNIYKEIYDDLKFGLDAQFAEMFNQNSLTNWAKQGVLLLNRCLTVRKGEAGSHQDKGWEQFTDAIIKKLNEKRKPIVYMLWGKKAQELEEMIDPRHLILKAAHPSPFSANNGFFGCKHFSKANEFLKQEYGKKIHWENHKNMYQF